MISEDYAKALSRGTKENRICAAAGHTTQLEVLDELISNVNIVTQENLGLVNIPVERIRGTKTSGRQSAFSVGFMPILPTETEFADKWSNLCNIHLREGIRVPIKAYEYMNNFYIEEGNKRVSVLKYFGAASIPGTVTRLIPAKINTLENEIYYDFLTFYRYTGINYIWFTRKGSFAKLCTATYKGATERWSQEDCQNFASFYYTFRAQFKALGGEELPITPADAALVYLSVHRYSDSMSALSGTILENLKKIWDEIVVLTETKAVELSLEPQNLPTGTPLLSKLWPGFASKPNPLKVVFLHELSATTSSWTKAHAEGRRALDANFPEQLITSHIDHIMPGVDDEIRIEAAARGGADVIFTTSAPMMPACLKVAARHPDLKILNCSLNEPHPLVRTYYPRMHEVKYLLGLLAGILSTSNEIGYISHYPIYGTPASINAFALGVQTVRPHAKIILRWTCLAQHSNILDFSDNPNVSIISGRDQQDLSAKEHMRAYNLYQCLADGTTLDIATPAVHWENFYQEILRSILDGTWTNEEADTQRAINYWWGLQSGTVRIAYSDGIPKPAQALVQLIESQLTGGAISPFAGKLRAQGGIEKHPKNGNQFSAEELMQMDWLLENVEGHIPHVNAIIPQARRLVSFQGLASVRE